MSLLAERALRIPSRVRGPGHCDTTDRHLRRRAISAISLGVASAIALLAIPFSLGEPRAAAQETSQTPIEETVANLAAGRVVIAVVKDAILVGTVENPIEVETLPPTPVALAGDRFGILLGAVDWSSTSAHEEIARLGQELPHLRGRLIADVPHLQSAQGGAEASDIEAIGQGVLERLNQVAQNLHGQVDLPDDEPLAELILADYLPGYGPEVWQLSYAMKQQEEDNDYWTTRVLRPSYVQFYPPEKKQPHTLVEFDYPPENAPPSLLELLRQKDPRVEQICSSDATMAGVANRFLEGDSDKVPAADAIQFLRATLNAIAPPSARQVMASLTEDNGLTWILPPPPEPVRPGQQKERPAGAPSLLKQPQ